VLARSLSVSPRSRLLSTLRRDPMIASERETVVNATDEDEVVRIWTAQRRFITQLRKHPKVTEIRCGIVDGSAWGEFEIPAAEWSPVRGIKHTRTMTFEQKAAISERLAAGRAAKDTEDAEHAA
jgi:hypothetical protein